MAKKCIDHDGMMKELLRLALPEFLAAFAPGLLREIDPRTIEFLDKEIIFTTADGERCICDNLAKARRRRGSGVGTIVILTESQAQVHPQMAMRAFNYFSAVHLRLGPPIYPILICIYPRPRRPEPSIYRMTVGGRRVLDFSFLVVQLNRQEWRKFLGRPNPAVAALLPLMNVGPGERAVAKFESLKMMARAGTPAQRQLIWAFLETYGNLKPQEERWVQEQVEMLPGRDKEKVMEFPNSWIEKGLHKGREEVVLRQLQRRFGKIPADVCGRVSQLRGDTLSDLAVALLDFGKLADAKAWLAAHARRS